MGKIVKLLAKYYPVYLSGLWGTLWISAVTVLLGLVLGMLVALMRMSRSNMELTLLSLLADGVISIAELDGFSEELREKLAFVLRDHRDWDHGDS